MKKFRTFLFLVLILPVGCNKATKANPSTNQEESQQPPTNPEDNNSEGEGEITEEEFCQSQVLLNSWPNQSTGATLNTSLNNLSGIQRDIKVLNEINLGNGFSLQERISAVHVINENSVLTFCVFNDYLSLNNSGALVRFPLGMTVLDEFISNSDWTLPTAKMVDLIYEQSVTKLSPEPIAPSSSMGSTQTIVEHSHKINLKLLNNMQFVGGHKKDIVISNRLVTRPDRIAIYGWHRLSGDPIQPLSTVHHKDYADYSHGVRLIFKTALLNDEVVELGDVLSKPSTASLISHEGVLNSSLIEKYY